MPAGAYDYHVLLAHDGAEGLAVATRLRDDLGRRGVSAWYEDVSQALTCAAGVVVLTPGCHRSKSLEAAFGELMSLERRIFLVASPDWRPPPCHKEAHGGPLDGLRMLFDRSVACPAHVRRADWAVYDADMRSIYYINLMVRELARFFEFSSGSVRIPHERPGDASMGQRCYVDWSRCSRTRR